MTTLWFIDTNVVAHWILGKGGVLDWMVDRFSLSDEMRDVYGNRYSDSIEVVDKILSQDYEAKHEFFLSSLVTNELFSALRDEVRSILLFSKGVPISRWRDARVVPEIPFTDYQSVYENALRAFDELFLGKRIQLIDEQSASSYDGYWSIYSSLLFRIRGSRTQDMTLVTTAIINKADYFMTADEPLIKSARKLLKDEYGLYLIKPSQTLQVFRGKKLY